MLFHHIYAQITKNDLYITQENFSSEKLDHYHQHLQ